MAPKLEKSFTMRAYIDKGPNLGAIKAGPVRSIVPIVGGFLEGSGLRAELIAGGGDWILLDPSTKTAHIDVRTQGRTADGDSVYIHYTGLLKMDDAAEKVLGWAEDAKTTEFGDHYWFNGLIIETSSEKFKWVETTLFVGQGHFVVDETGSAVEYEIYKAGN